jgi:hypothetical protein
MTNHNGPMFWLLVGALLAGGPELIIRAAALLVLTWQESRFWREYVPSPPTIKFSGFDPSNKEDYP